MLRYLERQKNIALFGVVMVVRGGEYEQNMGSEGPNKINYWVGVIMQIKKHGRKKMKKNPFTVRKSDKL